MGTRTVIKQLEIMGTVDHAAGAASAQSSTLATIAGDTALTGYVDVILTADALCYVAIGPNPTAAAGSLMVGTVPVTIRTLATNKIAAIQKSAAAIVNIAVCRP